VKVHFIKTKRKKDNYNVKTMTIIGAKLTRKARTKCKNRIDKREPKEEHIYELNGMTMKGKYEGKGSL